MEVFCSQGTLIIHIILFFVLVQIGQLFSQYEPLLIPCNVFQKPFDDYEMNSSLVCIWLKNNSDLHFCYKNSKNRIQCTNKKGEKAVLENTDDFFQGIEKNLKQAYDNSFIKNIVGDRRTPLFHYSLPQKWWKLFFLAYHSNKTDCQILRKSNGTMSNFYMINKDQYLEPGYNEENMIFYYINQQQYVEYCDLLPLSNEYEHLFKPFVAMNNAHCFDLITVWSNIFLFLKDYFYHASGNKRLQNSLREVFLSNARVLIKQLLAVYYGAMLLLLFQSNSSMEIIAVKCAALLHLCLHFTFVNEQTNT